MSTELKRESTSTVRNHPSYWRVFLTFVRNSLVRAMSFRMNFWLESISSMAWTLMNLGFFKIIFSHTDSIGKNTGWGESEFFVFLGTTWIITSLIQTFVMPNAQEFSELIRTGNLDFALLKPIDTQFLISFPKMDWSNLSNLFVGVAVVLYGLWELTSDPVAPLQISMLAVAAYFLFMACGLAILYSVMIALSSTSIWLGRNQTLYTFWFYITNFYRQPMEIYQQGMWGWALWSIFTFIIPILLVVNVPARIMAQPLRGDAATETLWLCAWAMAAAILSLVASRWVFKKALGSYRSASS